MKQDESRTSRRRPAPEEKKADGESHYPQKPGKPGRISRGELELVRAGDWSEGRGSGLWDRGMKPRPVRPYSAIGKPANNAEAEFVRRMLEEERKQNQEQKQ